MTIGTPAHARGGIRLTWHVRRTLGSAGIRVNGHRIASTRLAYRRGQRVALALDAADGVRFGRNAIVVTARGGGGRRQVVRRFVQVRRDAPLASVKAAPKGTVGRRIRLDGSSSRAAARRGLSYRWRIVQAPKGARVRLTAGQSVRPRLTASRPGRYWVALTVAERGKPAGRRAAQAAVSACTVAGSASAAGSVPAVSLTAASTPPADLPTGALTLALPVSAAPPPPPPASAAASGCATQVEAVTVGPNITPMGAAIDTHVVEGSQTGVAVAGTFYPVPQGPGGAAVLLFDAQTLELLAQTVDEGAQSPISEGEALAAGYSAAGRDVLIVVSGGAGCCVADHADSLDGFSAVENYIPGGGSQTSNEGLAIGDGDGARGELAGWLQLGVPLDGSPALYTFVSPDRALFDTQTAASTATSNTMQIGDQQYTSSLPAGATAGFQVLVADATLAPVIGPVAYGTDNPDSSAALEQETAMGNALASATGHPGSTVFVQSIGNPTPSTSAAVVLSQQLDALGGTPWMFLGLDGSGGYALVGNPGGIPGQSTSAETSAQWTASASGGNGSGSGSLNGMLRRGAASSYTPTLADAVDADAGSAPDFGLAQVAYQPAQAWPVDSTPAEVAATTWFAEQLQLTPGPGSCWQPPTPDFRSSYCDLATSPTALVEELQALDYSAGNGFAKADFAAVRAELERELEQVAIVQQMVTTLQTPFGSPAVSPATDAAQIAGDVISALPTPRQSATSADLAIVGSLFGAAALVPKAGQALGAIGSVFDFASAVTESGGTTRPYWQVQSAADSIGGIVQQRLATMSGAAGQLEDMLVSDPGKLSAAATGANGTWGVSAASLAQQESTLQLGIEQWMWTTIAPAAFTLDRFPGGAFAQSQIFCETDLYGNGWYPWASAASQSYFLPLTGWSGSGPQAEEALGMLSGSVKHRSSIAVTGTLANAMFSTPQQGGAALIAPWLLSQGSWTTVTPKAIGAYNQIGSCGPQA